MKRRISYFGGLFLTFLLFFVSQKIVFVCSNDPLSPGDLSRVIVHGLRLDISTTGYLLVLPFLVVWTSVWTRHMNARAVLRPYFILVAVLLSLICVADTSLYAFWKFKIDATIFNYTDTPKQALASVSGGYVALRLLCVTAFSVLLSWILIRLTPKAFPVLPVNLKMISWNFACALLGSLVFLAIRGGVGRSTMNVGSAYFSEDTYMNHAAVNPAFNLMYSWSKAEDFAGKYDYLREEKRVAAFAGLYPVATAPPTLRLLRTARPDILVIILEGFGGDYVKELGGAEDVAPEMSRLIRESIFFDNVYANSFRTDRGLVSALSGHVSYPTASIMKLPAKSRLLPGLARTLRRVGYRTDFLYGGDIDFTNMRSYFTTTGYTNLTADADFILRERTSSSWGAHDEYTFDRLYEMIASRPTGRPWHIGFLTLSSHEPFEVPYDRLKDKRQNSFAYTDHCLGTFIDRLKRLPEWDNLLVVCLPDHGSSSTFNVTSPAFYHIPMLWLGGAIKEPSVIHTLMNQSDFPATLLGQLGLPHQEFRFSRDVFSASYTYPFAYSTFNDGFMFKDSTGVTIFDNAAEKPIFENPSPDAVREENGKAILQTSYDLLGKM